MTLSCIATISIIVCLASCFSNGHCFGKSTLSTAFMSRNAQVLIKQDIF